MPAGPRDFAVQRSAAGRSLSPWPLVALYVGFPVWWLLGLGDVIWALLALPMLANLLRSGRILMPRGFGVWVLFLLWMLISVVQLDTGGRLVGFTFRAAGYIAVTVIFLYVYNSSRESLSINHICVLVTFFFAFVIAGGYLGIALPRGSFSTPMSYVVPQALQANELVSGMVRPRFAQYPLGASAEFVLPRPSAPFLYTNGWGSSYALLLPFVLVLLRHLRRGPGFWAVALLVPVSLVPAFMTQNRGMFLTVIVGLSYVALRFALRREFAGVLAVAALVAVIGALTVVVPVQDIVSARVSNSDTNDTRTEVYREAVERTVQSPVLGYGAPRPSERIAGGPAVGTQGQVWMVLFSHGFPGLALFVGWMLVVVARTRRARSTPALWLHVVCVMGLLESFFYGMLTSGLVLFMIAGAAALRERDFPGQSPSAA